MSDSKYITYDRRSIVRPYRVRVYQSGEGKLKYIGRYETMEKAMEARDNFIDKMTLQKEKNSENIKEDLENNLNCEPLKESEIPW